MRSRSKFSTGRQLARSTLPILPFSFPLPWLPMLMAYTKGGQKKSKQALLRKYIRSQLLRTSDIPAINSISPTTRQEPFVAPNNLTRLSSPRERKQRYFLEGWRPGKRLRQDSQPISEFHQPLSKENLNRHDRLTGSNDMTPSATNPVRGGRKKNQSHQSSTTETNQDTASVISQKSIGTIAQYRWVDLNHVRISVQSGPLPEEIKPRIDAVIQRKVSNERKVELSCIAERLCTEFIAVLSGASREDDCVEPIHQALSAMDKGGNFISPRKAGMAFLPYIRISRYAHVLIDWDISLKPKTQRRTWDMSFLETSNDEGAIFGPRPPKRHQGASPHLSPDALQGPYSPPPSPKQDISSVKTPRPDITAGLRHDAVVDAMMKQGLANELDAGDFLQYLQVQRILCSDPAQQVLPIRFPFLVIEGKSYSTGRPIFEAQNQAAVSGSCMTNLQHMLAELTESASPGCMEYEKPLAFSICTEGPIIELWVHYTILKNGIRLYYMNIIKICHASLLSSVIELLVMVDSVMSWASVDFVNHIAKQLVLVLEKAR